MSNIREREEGDWSFLSSSSAKLSFELTSYQKHFVAKLFQKGPEKFKPGRFEFSSTLNYRFLMPTY